MEETLIERVARAFAASYCEDETSFDQVFDDVDRAQLLRAARAAIGAMREPTKAMVDAARVAGPVILVERDVGKPHARTPLAEEVRAMHTAMIDAALSPSSDQR